MLKAQHRLHQNVHVLLWIAASNFQERVAPGGAKVFYVADLDLLKPVLQDVLALFNVVLILQKQLRLKVLIDHVREKGHVDVLFGILSPLSPHIGSSLLFGFPGPWLRWVFRIKVALIQINHHILDE